MSKGRGKTKKATGIEKVDRQVLTQSLSYVDVYLQSSRVCSALGSTPVKA